MTFRILFVCTGNICRSPTAELLTRAGAAPGADLAVSSAGTHALVGHGIDPPTASALSARGANPGVHRARQFEAHMAAGADLVLVAERSHRDLVMTAAPRAHRRTFTVREFARLSRHLPAGDPVDVVARAARMRGIDGSDELVDDDVPDPYRRSSVAAEESAALIAAAVETMLNALGLEPPPQPQTRPRPAPRPSRPRPTRG